MRRLRRYLVGAIVVVLALAAASCADDGLEPQALVAGTDACAFCRMTVSQIEFAGQLVVDGELPMSFDDLGCLTNYLTIAEPPSGAFAIYAMDHSDKTWLPAETAVYGRVMTLSTPMGSHLVAHASVAVKDADGDMTGWTSATVDDVIPLKWRRATTEGR